MGVGAGLYIYVDVVKSPLGTAVGLGLRDIVLDGDPAPLP